LNSAARKLVNEVAAANSTNIVFTSPFLDGRNSQNYSPWGGQAGDHLSATYSQRRWSGVSKTASHHLLIIAQQVWKSVLGQNAIAEGLLQGEEMLLLSYLTKSDSG
jgi:hypothetical protein